MIKFLLSFVCVATVASAAPLAPLDAPFPMPPLQRPVFPARDFSIVERGAVGGSHLDTAAIQAAIDACHRAGGGRVVVPAGRWLTGPLVLKSNVDLHLADGAVLAFTDEKKYYFGPDALTPPAGGSQTNPGATGRKLLYPPPLIQATGAENIAITGRGTLDGQGIGWWPLHTTWWERAKKEKPNAAAAAEHAWRGLDRDTLPQRPRMFEVVHCRNVLLEGFTAKDSPFWTINPVACENVIVRGLTIRAAWPGPSPHAPNTDGVNPESCRNVLIEDCDIVTGDDAIAIKSGLDAAGRQRGLPTENLVIRGVRGTRIAIGSEMSGGVRNVFIHDCSLGAGGPIFSIKTRRGRGGVVENIWVQDIEARAPSGPLVRVEMQYWTQVDPAPPEPVSDRTPRIRHLHFARIHPAAGARNTSAIYLNGLPEMPISDVSFDDMPLRSARGITISYAQHLRFDRVSVDVTRSPLLTLTDVDDISFRALSIAGSAAPLLVVRGAKSRAIRFDPALAQRRDAIVFEHGAAPGSVTFAPDPGESP